jgi:DNA-binding XRE family transcriptional regulator
VVRKSTLAIDFRLLSAHRRRMKNPFRKPGVPINPSADDDIVGGRRAAAPDDLLKSLSFQLADNPEKPLVARTIPQVTPAQLRAARALLDLTQEQLAADAQVAPSTIKDFEAGRRTLRNSSMDRLRRALEDQGVNFIDGHPKLGTGVTLKP